MTEEQKTRYSFSRITPHCLYSWYNSYILGDRGENNAFSQYGTVGHEILEEWHNGELFTFELSSEFDKRFKTIDYNFPPNAYCDLSDRYYQAGKQFFDSYCEDFFKDYKILEIEQERIWTINGIEFIGFPDFVGKYKDSAIHIVDYKSAAPYKKDDLKKKIKQLYLYSIPIYNIYSEYPSHLVFLHYRHSKPVKIKFDINVLEETKQWAVEQVKMLENLTEYPPNTESEWFCNWLCGHRNMCPYKK